MPTPAVATMAMCITAVAAATMCTAAVALVTLMGSMRRVGGMSAAAMAPKMRTAAVATTVAFVVRVSHRRQRGSNNNDGNPEFSPHLT
jgi:hypothetical protein